MSFSQLRSDEDVSVLSLALKHEEEKEEERANRTIWVNDICASR